MKLAGLSLWQNELTGHGAQCLAEGMQVYSLPFFHLSIQYELVAHALAQVNKTLLWLGLGSNTIGAEGMWALAESLRTNTSLLWLGLGGNELGDRGALHLAGLLQGRPYPSILYIY